MRTFQCQCGHPVFFDNTACGACGRRLGFDWDRLELLSLEPGTNDRWIAMGGRVFKRCENDIQYGICNGLVDVGASPGRCLSCARNRLIPSLDQGDNLALWNRVEEAKRRLLYSLLSQGLPLDDGQGNSLKFRIMEDQRRNPDVNEAFVPTAHQGGTITLNLAEADPVERQALREQMQERYRTVLGHLRHEAGHFYYQVLVIGRGREEAFRALFGDGSRDYDTALAAHYANGPPEDWAEHYISAYAAAHPQEDFAESFAHYLHIRDALESAIYGGLMLDADALGDAWLTVWSKLAVGLNEIGRSLGWEDPYPFVLTESVRDKLLLIDRLVRSSS